MLKILFLFLLTLTLNANTFSIASYNVENLFDLNEENSVFNEVLSVYSDVLEDYKKIEILNYRLATELEKFDEIMEELSILTVRYEKEEGYSLEYKVKYEQD